MNKNMNTNWKQTAAFVYFIILGLALWLVIEKTFAAGPSNYYTVGANNTLVLNYRLLTAAGGASPTSSDYLIACNSTAGAITINLPQSSASSKRILLIKKVDASANAVNIHPFAGDAIDSVKSDRTITTQGTSLTLQSNGGGQWYIE